MAETASPAPITASPMATAQRTRLLTSLLVIAITLVLFGLAAMMAVAVKKLPLAAIHIDSTSINRAELSQLKRLLGERATANFIQADLTSYVEKLRQVDWIEQADIRRDWQRGLVVTVIPRQPVAKFGSERLVDGNGKVFKPVDTTLLDNPQWVQLQGDPQQAMVMMQQAKQVSDWYAPLGLHLQEIIATPRMAWLFRFDNGLRVLADNENTSEKLYRLSIMLNNQLKPKLANIQTVDLRYKNGMAITWRQSALNSTQTVIADPSGSNGNKARRPVATAQNLRLSSSPNQP